MRVSIKAFATFRNVLGKERLVEIAEGEDITDLLNALCNSFGGLQDLLFDDSGLKDDVNILVNGRNIQALNGVQTKLADGDELALFPAAIGG